jgi:hypothetical protein
MLSFRGSGDCEAKIDRVPPNAPGLLDLRSAWECDCQAELYRGRCRPSRLANSRAQTRVSLAEGEGLVRKPSD